MQPLATCFTAKSWACPVLCCLKISAGGRRHDWIMSFLQKLSRSSLSRLICPLLFGIHQTQPFNISQIVQVTSTELSRLLCACISPFGLAGLRSLSRLSLKSLKRVKQEIVSTQNLGSKLPSAFKPAHTIWNERTLDDQASPCRIPAWLAPFFYWLCYSVLWIELCSSPTPQPPPPRCWHLKPPYIKAKVLTLIASECDLVWK